MNLIVWYYITIKHTESTQYTETETQNQCTVHRNRNTETVRSTQKQKHRNSTQYTETETQKQYTEIVDVMH